MKQPEIRVAGKRLLVGRITAAYGIKGWVKIFSYTQPVEQILNYRPWSLAAEGPGELEIEEGRVHGKGVIARLKGCNTRNQAEAEIGQEIWVDREMLPELEGDAYYWYQLEGLEVINIDGDKLGRIDHLMGSGAGDIMSVRYLQAAEQGSDGKQEVEKDRLIPFVMEEVVKQVDLESGQVIVDWAADW